MSFKENERDAHIKAIYFILVPLVLVSIAALFVAVLAWNSAARPASHTDAITWSLTVIEIILAMFSIMLGIVAVFGFWAVRGAAVAAAKREARIYLDEKAGALFQQVGRTQQAYNGVEEPEIPEGVNEADIFARAEEEQDDDGDGNQNGG